MRNVTENVHQCLYILKINSVDPQTAKKLIRLKPTYTNQWWRWLWSACCKSQLKAFAHSNYVVHQFLGMKTKTSMDQTWHSLKGSGNEVQSGLWKDSGFRVGQISMMDWPGNRNYACASKWQWHRWSTASIIVTLAIMFASTAHALYYLIHTHIILCEVHYFSNPVLIMSCDNQGTSNQ